MSLEEVRDILYDILVADDNDRQDNLEPIIKATQHMGVSVSSAVSKNGVKIFQLQSVVQRKVIHHVVRALKALNSMPPIPVITGEIVEIKALPEPKKEKTLEEIIEEALDNAVSSALFLKSIERRYVLAAIERYGTYKETAEKIKISYSKLMMVKRATEELKIED
jgi:hypothetical protein